MRRVAASAQPSPADASYPQGSSTCILEQQRRKKVGGDQMTGSWVSHFKCFFFWLAPGKYFHDLRRLYIDVIEQPCHCFINICLIAHLAFCPTGTVRNSWWKTNFCYISVGVSLWMWMGYVNLTTYDSFSWKNFLLFTVVQGLVNRCGWIIERTNQDQISIWFLWMAHSLKRWRTPYTLQSKAWKRSWFLIYI